MHWLKPMHKYLAALKQQCLTAPPARMKKHDLKWLAPTWQNCLQRLFGILQMELMIQYLRMRSPFMILQYLASRQQRSHNGSSDSIAYMYSSVLVMLVISLIAKDAAYSSMAWLAIHLRLVGSLILPAPLSPSTRPLRHHPCLGTSHLLMA